MSVKSEVLDLLQRKAWVSVSDFESIFPPGTEGHLSWGQRMRELRAEGMRIDKRLKVGSKHTFEYSLIKPEERKVFEERNGQMAFIG